MKYHYHPVNENDAILIAAKKWQSDEPNKVIKIKAYVPPEEGEDLTNELVEMESLLNEKEAKAEPKATTEPQAKTETKPASKIDELEKTIKLMDTLKKVNYRELQKKLKAYRKEGKTNIKLNRTKAALYLELQRIEGQ